MTPPEDQLTTFLRQYRPEPPPASEDLEDRILAAVAVSPPPRQQIQPIHARLLWIPAAIMAGVALIWAGGQWLAPPRTLTASEIEELESFLETTWSGVLEDPGVSDPLFNL